MELIFTEPDIIASPSYDQNDSFSVVLSQTLFRTGRLQARMKKNNLQASKPFRVNPGLYQACLRYTMLAKLAPVWNKAGDWLIQGRDFLTHSGRANAVKCEVVCNTDELYMSVSASVLRLSPLQLGDLNLSDLEVQTLLYNAEHRSGELTLHNAWCRVLPSMKKARLCSISLSVPEDSPFTSYRDLRRHWKNTYGFRLPETDDDVFYAQISFWGLGGKQFTYPNVCLRSDPLQCIPRVEPKPILSTFLQDLHSRVPSACGNSLHFQPRVQHTVLALYSAAQDVRGPGPNLSKRSITGGSQVPLRDPRDLVHTQGSSQQLSGSSQLAVLKATVHRHTEDDTSPSQAFSTVSQSLFQSNSTPCEPSQHGVKWFQISRYAKSGSVLHTPDSQQRPDNADKHFSGDRHTSITAIGELAQPRLGATSLAKHQSSSVGTPLPQTQHHQNSTDGLLDTMGQQTLLNPSQAVDDRSQAKIVPIFKPKTLQGSQMKHKSTSNADMTCVSQEPGVRFVPVFKPKLSKAKDPTRTKARNSFTHPADSAVVSCPQVTSSTGDNPVPTSQAVHPLALPAFPARKPSCHKTPVFKSITPQGRTSLAGKLKKKMTDSKPSPTEPATSKKNMQYSLVPSPQGDGTGSLPCFGTQEKRKMADQGGTEKKARNKPQVQDVDVEMLARSNQLNKVNALTLMTWLKDNGVHCKSKDKKAELVDRVKVFLAITSSEP